MYEEKVTKKGNQKKPNKKGRMNNGRGKQQKKGRKSKEQEKGKEVELEREVAAFKLMVERETGSIYHLKKQLQKKK